MHLFYIFVGIACLFVLYLISRYSYLLFHSITEFFSIVVGCGIFMIAWNSRRFAQNNYLLFLGISYLYISFLDLLHTLSYKGMGVFPVAETNLATQLWIASRYIEAATLLIAPLFLTRKLKSNAFITGFGLFVLLILGSIFYWDIFPNCYVEGVGLTEFKKISEYIISGLLVGAVFHLMRNRNHFEPFILRLLGLSIVLTIGSELCFTFYINVYGVSNLIGHSLKVLSFFLIYKAIIETGLVAPYELLFRDLKQNELSLRQARDRLELRIDKRTRELAEANEGLRREIAERECAQNALRESEQKYSSIIEESLTGVYISLNGRIVFANEMFASIYGYQRDEILGQESLNLVHPDDLPRVKQYIHLRLRGDSAPSEYEAKGLTKDGRTIWVMRRNKVILLDGEKAILGNVIDVTGRKEMERELRQLSYQLIASEEGERKRISRELHDSIGQSLSAIRFSLENAKEQMKRGSTDSALSIIESAVPMAQETIEEVRNVIMALRPSMLDDLGVIPTLNWACREFESIYTNMTIEKAITAQEEEIPEMLKLVIYRVIQEALNNVAKHSRASQIHLSLHAKDGFLELGIQDNGIGFDPKALTDGPSRLKGFGLSSMRERVQLSGGTLNIRSSMGDGTALRASWPIPTPAVFRP